MANFIQRASDSISGFMQSYEKFSKQLQVEQYSPRSIQSYGHKLAAISFHFKKLPEHLSEEDCRDYFSMLLSRSPSPGLSYFKHTVYSLRCYRKTMHLCELHFSLPRIRSTKKLPVVLSQSEVSNLLRHCISVRSQALLALIYSCGLRLRELINMRICDIDSQRMQVFIRQGKGGKDRYVPLSTHLLLLLREYFIQHRPEVYLFNNRSGGQIEDSEIRYLFKQAVHSSRILKPCTLHTLRHSYATHLLEMGENILRIRDLLGHADIKTTLIYLHLVNLPAGGYAFSPLDRLDGVGNNKARP